ncbi:MAG: hypothetical protein AB7P76_04770 [Candidatus Melainabacteria bacterium]
MHFYEINLKQGPLYIQLSSDDVYFISQQMNKWFEILLDERYVPVKLPERPAAPPPVAAASPPAAPAPGDLPPVQQAVAAAPAPAPVAEPTPVTAPAPPAAKDPLPVPVPYTPSAPEPIPAAVPVLPVAEAPPSDAIPQLDLPFELPAEAAAPAEMPVAPMPPPASSPVPAAAVVSEDLDLDEGVKDDFEAVMSSLMEDLGGSDAPAPSAPTAQPAPAAPAGGSEFPMLDLPDDLPPVVMPSSTGPAPAPSPVPAFAEVAPQTAAAATAVMDAPAAFESPASAPAASAPGGLFSFDSLGELCTRVQPKSPEEFLSMTAFFLTFYEGLDKFSMKRVNSLLVKSGLTPINHSVMEAALSQKHIAIVPDLTGMAETSEYTLTEAGQEFARSLLP